MKPITKDYFKSIGLVFLLIIMFGYLNSPLIMASLPLLGITMFIYQSIKGKEKLKLSSFKKIFPTILITSAFSGLDIISTKFFVLNEGIANEGNPLMRNLILYFGEKVLLFIPLFLLFFLLLYCINQFKNEKESIAQKNIKHTSKIICGIYIFIFILNVLI